MSELVKEIKNLDNTVVVRATGQLTFEKSPEFHHSLVEICTRAPEHLVIDLTEVSYIDSSGVGTLTEIFQRLKRTSGRLSLVGLNKMVRGVFEITRLDSVFAIYDTEEEALQS